MDQHRLNLLVLFLAREVAALHGKLEAISDVVEELRVVDPRLDSVQAHDVQKQAWQDFLSRVEDLDPTIAALIDDRKQSET